LKLSVGLVNFCICRLTEDGTQAPIYVEVVLIMSYVV